MAEFADTFAEICALFIAELQQEYNRGLDELRVRVTDTADIDALYAHAEAEAQQIQAQPGTA
jgi:F0F1-type ATP synthase membrane subunit b/b'